jgi:2-keto-4-pentenoate hydratase/2-oxohepta-3-ene-1,7-dioic acid hydratase in catechol pathway
MPKVSDCLDYEGELAIIIGSGGRYISEQDAMGCIAGFSCYNDATLRDWQRHTHQFTPGKNFPGTGAFGPYMVTPDEISGFSGLGIKTLLNGIVMQEAKLGDMIFGLPKLISYISGFTSLSPGDIICTGTPGGVGFKRDPQLFMKPGDLVEVIIDGVGHLVNKIEAES